MDDDISFAYIDNDGIFQGPFSQTKMQTWWEHGYFNNSLDFIVMKKIANAKLNDLVARNGEWNPFEWKDEYNQQGTQTDLAKIVKNKQIQAGSATKEKSTNTILAKEVKPITEQPNQLCSLSSPTARTITSSSVPLEQSIAQYSEITKKQRRKRNKENKPPNIPFHIGLINDGSDGLMNEHDLQRRLSFLRKEIDELDANHRTRLCCRMIFAFRIPKRVMCDKCGASYNGPYKIIKHIISEDHITNLLSDGLCFSIKDYNRLQKLIEQTAPDGWNPPEMEQEYTDDEFTSDQSADGSQYDEDEVIRADHFAFSPVSQSPTAETSNSKKKTRRGKRNKILPPCIPFHKGVANNGSNDRMIENQLFDNLELLDKEFDMMDADHRTRLCARIRKDFRTPNQFNCERCGSSHVGPYNIIQHVISQNHIDNLTSDGLCFRVSDFNQLQNLIVKTAPAGWTIPEVGDISDEEEQEYTDEYEDGDEQQYYDNEYQEDQQYENESQYDEEVEDESEYYDEEEYENEDESEYEEQDNHEAPRDDHLFYINGNGYGSEYEFDDDYDNYTYE